MKITLTELRQMVRNIISEMDNKYTASSEDNFMTITQGDVDDEEYKILKNKQRINTVIDLVLENVNFIVTNCISFSGFEDYESEYSLIEKMDDVKEGEFKVNNGSYDYFVVESDNGEQRILVKYITKKGRVGYAEEFIFEGYLKESEEEEEIVDDEYPRNWTSPEKF